MWHAAFSFCKSNGDENCDICMVVCLRKHYSANVAAACLSPDQWFLLLPCFMCFFMGSGVFRHRCASLYVEKRLVAFDLYLLAGKSVHKYSSKKFDGLSAHCD